MKPGHTADVDLQARWYKGNHLGLADSAKAAKFFTFPSETPAMVRTAR
jgi:hypothetical protein